MATGYRPCRQGCRSSVSARMARSRSRAPTTSTLVTESCGGWEWCRCEDRGVKWMHRTRFLCALGVLLWAAVVTCSQAAAPAALSGALQDQVKNGRFGIVTSIRGLPLGVREELQTMWGSRTLDIAEPGTE